MDMGIRFPELLSFDAKVYPFPYRDRYMCKCVTTNIFPVVTRQLAEKIEFNDFKKALNVIRSLKLSLVI